MKTKNKQKISITLDEETLILIENALKNQDFRNRSHAIEFSINKMLSREEEK
jgi:metal-responsive CopG/Arc/MetJ family transcriptional regulator